MTPDQWADKAIDAFTVHGHELTGPQRKQLHAAVSLAVGDAMQAVADNVVEEVRDIALRFRQGQRKEAA